jgi:predicted transposase YdaD
MAGPWDSAGKLLMRLIPQHIVTWLLEGAVYIRTLSPELQSRDIFADGLFAVMENGLPALMHIEFQSRSHPIMPQRLLKYNVLAASENDWQPVHTYVIYLRYDGRVPEPPLVRRYNDGRPYHQFDYTVVEMAKVSARSILQTGLLGIYPLIPLADKGSEPDVVQEMVTTLAEEREIDLLVLAYTFSGLVSGGEAYKSWFRRSFTMLEDILEESVTYQEIKKLGLLQGLQEGLQQGLQEGLQQGLQEGLQQGLQLAINEQHHAVIGVVERLFPDLASFAQPRIEAIRDADVLHSLLDEILAAKTAEEARQAIINARAEE